MNSIPWQWEPVASTLSRTVFAWVIVHGPVYGVSVVPAGTPVVEASGKAPLDCADGGALVGVLLGGADELGGAEVGAEVGAELGAEVGAELGGELGAGLAVTVLVTVAAGGFGTVQTTLIWDPALTWVTVGAEVHDAVGLEVVAAWTTATPPTSTRPVAVAATTPSRRRDKEMFIIV
jgi:hypothetical protein